MPNIRVDLSIPIYDGQPVTFKSPADCSTVTGLVVYYPYGGTTVSKTFQLADAHGNNVGSIDLFTADVLVKVILDTGKSRAYVQNADTNAYLEGMFERSIPRMTKVILSLTEWTRNNYTRTYEQTVAVDGILADETAQIVTVAPAIPSKNNAVDAGIYCSAQGENSLTFTCETIPIADVVMIVTWQKSHWLEPVIKLITFTIADTPCQAEAGMTWAEWCDSEYNPKYVEGDVVYHCAGPNGLIWLNVSIWVQYNGTDVHGSETIIANAAYTHFIDR